MGGMIDQHEDYGCDVTAGERAAERLALRQMLHAADAEARADEPFLADVIRLTPEERPVTYTAAAAVGKTEASGEMAVEWDVADPQVWRDILRTVEKMRDGIAPPHAGPSLAPVVNRILVDAERERHRQPTIEEILNVPRITGPAKAAPRVARNGPCPCGCGRKAKRCGGGSGRR